MPGSSPSLFQCPFSCLSICLVAVNLGLSSRFLIRLILAGFFVCSFWQDFQCFWGRTDPEIFYSTIFFLFLVTSLLRVFFFFNANFLFGHHIHVVLHMENMKNMVFGRSLENSKRTNGQSFGYSNTPFSHFLGENHISR